MADGRKAVTQSLDSRLAALNKPISDLYYAITLTADDNLNVVFGTQTLWTGWSDDDPRHEIRKARPVYPEFVKLWKNLRQPYAYIHTVDELTLFLLAGGNALVECTLAEQIFPNLLGEEVSVPDGRIGFAAPAMFEASAFRRAPTPKVRMEILKRDGRRCRICGRRPEDNSDVVLHVHHIRTWEKGGVTDPANLITLCHTCHSGLEPHDDHSLFAYIEPEPKDALEALLQNFAKGVANYRRVGFFGDLDQDRAHKPPKRRGQQPTGR